MTARQLTKQELDALRTDMQAASVLMKVALAERRQEKGSLQNSEFKVR